jgi:maltose O-acetyltransferase
MIRGLLRRGLAVAYPVVGAVARRLERHLTRAQLVDLERRGAKIGEHVMVFGRFYFHGDPRLLTIGDRCTINGGAVLNATAPLTLGRDVRVSSHAQIHTDELVPDTSKLHREHRTGAVTIGDGTWLAAGCVVVPGVSIGARAIVGAGAVVVADVAGATLVAGVPARVVRVLGKES